MITEHPTVFELLRALEERHSVRLLARRVLAHLARVEPACAPAESAIEDAERRAADTKARDYSAAFAAAAARTESAARRIEEEEKGAQQDLDRLLAERVGARRDRFDRSRGKYRGAGFAEMLLAETRASASRSARESRELASIAREVCQRLSDQHYGKGLRGRLALRAEALYANALRAAGELVAADRHWHLIATRRADAPLADPAAEADLASLEASLRFDQRRLEEAGALAARAVELYREAGDRAGEGRALIKQGIAARLAGDHRHAAALLEAALSILDGEANARERLNGVSNLTLCLCDAGEFSAAAAAVSTHRDLYERFADGWTMPRFAWLEARIARGLGDFPGAERHLRVALNAYLGEANGFNAALAALDLAKLLFEQARTVEVKRLAFATHRAFAEREVRPEAAESIRLFAQAAAAEKVTLELLDRLRERLEAARLRRPRGSESS